MSSQQMITDRRELKISLRGRGQEVLLLDDKGRRAAVDFILEGLVPAE